MSTFKGKALVNVRSGLVIALTLICEFEFQLEEPTKC